MRFTPQLLHLAQATIVMTVALLALLLVAGDRVRSWTARVFLQLLRRLGQAAIVVSFLLLAINLVGTLRTPISEAAPGQIAGFHYPTVDPDPIRLLLDGTSNPTSDSAWLERAHAIVANGLAHGSVATLRFEQNWLLWLNQRVTGNLLTATQDPMMVVDTGRGFCSQTAAVLQEAATRAGLPARFLSFDGHVALEVKADGRWRVADTDYDILYPFDAVELADPGNRDRVSRLLAAKGHDEATIEYYLDIVQDEVAFRHPIGDPHDALSAEKERAAAKLIWLIPLFGLVLGRILLEGSKRLR